MRLYHLRPDGLQSITHRFDRLLPPMLERHGIEVLGAWVADDGEAPAFAYVMAYDSLAERERQWDAFYADPDWPTLRAEANAGGDPIVTMDIWVVRNWELDVRFQDIVSAAELRQDIVVGLASAESPDRSELPNHLGMTGNQKDEGHAPILAGDVMFGPRLPAAMAIWPDRSAGNAIVDRGAGKKCILTRLSAIADR